MTVNYVHPLGLAPPAEWSEPGRRVTTAEFQEWLAMKPGDVKQGRAKYGQQAGYYADLGLHLKSKLEAKTLRLLRFQGYQMWTNKGVTPPGAGLWVAYEWQKYRLVYKAGKADERPLFYLADWHLWDNGRLSIWESKGLLDQRSKRLLKLMQEQVQPVVLITAEELEARKAEALYAARRRGERVIDILHWDEGPTKKN